MIKLMLRFPSRDCLSVYTVQTALLLLLFSIVYGTTNYWAQSTLNPYHLWFAQELTIPFVPEFIFIYFSINLLTLVPLFVLEVAELKALSGSFAGAIVSAGLIFYIVPAPIGWPRPGNVGKYDIFYHLLFSLDQAANTFPSLHITFGFLCSRVLVDAEPRLKLIWIWFGLIALSVLLTHQHHLIDIAGGVILGESCYRWIYNSLKRKT